MLKKTAVISLVAGAMLFIAPTMASAAPFAADASDNYARTPEVSVDDPVIGSCQVSSVMFGPGYFLASEEVGVSISGLDAGAAAVSGNIAAADGSMIVSFRPPADGEGSYSVTFSGSRSYTATITVSRGRDAAATCDHDPAVAPAGTELPLSGSLELALTGGALSPWVLGGGVAALAAGGALVALGVSRRRRV